jgi:hypothetical protein
LTWARCECGCDWEGEDEVTQWLIEEAAFYALDVEELQSTPEQREADELMRRHGELTALRDRMQA